MNSGFDHFKGEYVSILINVNRKNNSSQNSSGILEEVYDDILVLKPTTHREDGKPEIKKILINKREIISIWVYEKLSSGDWREKRQRAYLDGKAEYE